MVVVTGNNNEKLSTSELLKTKRNAWKNVRAQMGQFRIDDVVVQDNSLPSPKKFIVSVSGLYNNTVHKGSIHPAPQVK
jgi:hypothetical protein